MTLHRIAAAAALAFGCSLALAQTAPPPVKTVPGTSGTTSESGATGTAPAPSAVGKDKADKSGRAAGASTSPGTATVPGSSGTSAESGATGTMSSASKPMAGKKDKAKAAKKDKTAMGSSGTAETTEKKESNVKDAGTVGKDGGK